MDVQVPHVLTTRGFIVLAYGNAVAPVDRQQRRRGSPRGRKQARAKVVRQRIEVLDMPRGDDHEMARSAVPACWIDDHTDMLILMHDPAGRTDVGVLATKQPTERADVFVRFMTTHDPGPYRFGVSPDPCESLPTGAAG